MRGYERHLLQQGILSAHLALIASNLQAGGYLQKRLADRVLLTPDTEASTSGRDASRFIRCHRCA